MKSPPRKARGMPPRMPLTNCTDKRQHGHTSQPTNQPTAGRPAGQPASQLASTHQERQHLQHHQHHLGHSEVACPILNELRTASTTRFKLAETHPTPTLKSGQKRKNGLRSAKRVLRSPCRVAGSGFPLGRLVGWFGRSVGWLAGWLVPAPAGRTTTSLSPGSPSPHMSVASFAFCSTSSGKASGMVLSFLLVGDVCRSDIGEARTRPNPQITPLPNTPFGEDPKNGPNWSCVLGCVGASSRTFRKQNPTGLVRHLRWSLW